MIGVNDVGVLTGARRCDMPGCLDPIAWRYTDHGARIALEPEPNPLGEYVLIETGDSAGRFHFVRRDEWHEFVDVPHYVCHTKKHPGVRRR